MVESLHWEETEPRLNFPIFGGYENVIDLTLQDAPRLTARKVVAPLYHFVKRRKPLGPTLLDYANLLFDPPYRFRASVVDRDGRLVHSGEFPGSYRSGDYFCCNVNEWIAQAGKQVVDGGFILISSRGRGDLWNSSPGNATLRVVGARNVTGYRTGFFCRQLNTRGKKHWAFTGLNPQIEVGDDAIAGILLVNHSSDPGYDREVTPVVRLHRTASDFIEASFGAIPPHATRERSILDLFPDARNFLGPNNGAGFTVTTAKGASLASVHVLRSAGGDLLSLEHSRPAHPNIVRYL